MTIEGLGKKFQDARRTRNLTLDEAARMTKIRPARLAEIEALGKKGDAAALQKIASDEHAAVPSLAHAGTVA